LLGEIARNSGANCSPAAMLTGLTRYGRPHSSSMIEIFQPLGVGQKYRSIGSGDVTGLTEGVGEMIEE
jgi:hypothetical protein